MKCQLLGPCRSGSCRCMVTHVQLSTALSPLYQITLHPLQPCINMSDNPCSCKSRPRLSMLKNLTFEVILHIHNIVITNRITTSHQYHARALSHSQPHIACSKLLAASLSSSTTTNHRSHVQSPAQQWNLPSLLL